jgi:hypothetical protein
MLGAGNAISDLDRFDYFCERLRRYTCVTSGSQSHGSRHLYPDHELNTHSSSSNCHPHGNSNVDSHTLAHEHSS